jgi:hypothetical protein
LVAVNAFQPLSGKVSDFWLFCGNGVVLKKSHCYI